MDDVRRAQILLVEDNEADAELAREALAEGKILNELNVVGDGILALQYLRAEGPFYGRPMPDLIILDLNLPKKDGRKVLAEIKADPLLRRIPVVILTSSRKESDIEESYDSHANCYIQKPIDVNSFMAAVAQLKNFWFSIVTLPLRR